MGKITADHSQINSSLELPVISKNDYFLSSSFFNKEIEWNSDSGEFTIEREKINWENNSFQTAPNKSVMIHDSTMDSGLGSAKSLSPRSLEPEWNNNVDDCDMRTEHLIEDHTSVLFNILDIKEDSWHDDEPPCKILKKDDSNILSYNSVANNSTVQTNLLNSISQQKNTTETVMNDLQNSICTEIQNLKNGQSLLKENPENNSTPALNVSNFTEEATFGEHDIQNNCETPDLAHLQKTLRALIREVTQSSGENKAVSDSPSYSSPISSSNNSTSKFTSKLSTVKCNNSGSLPKKEAVFKKSILCASFPSRKKDSNLELRILSQPEEQHRARYLTEGSRGSIKDRRGTGFPTVKLFGYNEPVTLQVFIGTDQGRVQPHLFYQASQVCGKNSTPCIQTKIDGTTVLEITMLPDKDMTVSCDCIGILKERNVDVEQRLLNYGGTRSKKRSTRCRIIFRVSVPIQDNVEILQVASAPIICTQPPGIPEICRVSLSSCPAKGECELFIIGKNFLKDTKVIFKDTSKCSQINSGIGIENNPWEVEVEPEKEYLQPTHLICLVPPYHKLDVIEAVKINLYVQSGDKLSEPYPFTYTPLSSVLSHPSIPVLSQELPLGVAASAVEINQQYSQTGTVPSIIQLPIMTTTPSKQMIVIPTVNSTMMATGTASLQNTVNLGSPVISGCSNTFVGQVKSPQLQLIVVQPSNMSTTKPEKIDLPNESKNENSISNFDDNSSSKCSPSEIENQSSTIGTSNNSSEELNSNDNIKIEERENSLNQQYKTLKKNDESSELNSLNLENNNQREILNNQNLNESINDSSLIPDWHVISNICNSMNDCQQQYCFNNDSGIHKNINVVVNNNQETINSTLYYNSNNETQTLRELLLQGRQNASNSSSSSSSSSQIINTSVNRKEFLSSSENEVIQQTIIPDFTAASITNSQDQGSEKIELFPSEKNDFSINNFSFQPDSSVKETNKQLEYSVQDIDNLPSANSVMYYEKYIHSEENSNLNREFLSNSFNNTNREKSDLFKLSINKTPVETQNATSLSNNQILPSSEQSDIQESNFNMSNNICQTSIITDQQERIDANKKNIKQQNVRSIINEGLNNNFQDVPNSGSNVDNFSDITMLPEVELLSMINPSTFDNV